MKNSSVCRSVETTVSSSNEEKSKKYKQGKKYAWGYLYFYRTYFHYSTNDRQHDIKVALFASLKYFLSLNLVK